MQLTTEGLVSLSDLASFGLVTPELLGDRLKAAVECLAKLSLVTALNEFRKAALEGSDPFEKPANAVLVIVSCGPGLICA